MTFEISHSNNCYLNSKCETLDILYPPKNKFNNLRRKLHELILISEEHVRKSFAPMGTIGYIFEKDFHLNRHKYMVHPHSKLRLYWESVIVVKIFISLFVRSLIGAQHKEERFMPPVFQASILIGDVTDFADFVFDFFVGYKDKESRNTVLDIRKIFFYKVTQLYFYVNLIASFPFASFAYIYALKYECEEAEEVFMHAVFIKILKLYTFTLYLKNISKIYNWKGLKFFAIWGVSFNFLLCCCISGWLHLVTNHDVKDSEKIDIEHAWISHHLKIFFTVCSAVLNRSGFINVIEIRAFTDELFWCLAIAGILFTNLINASIIIQYLGLQRTSKVCFEEMNQEARLFLVQENIPKHIHKKVEDYFHFRYWGKYFNETLIFETLSPPVKREVIKFICMNLLLNPKSIFFGIPENLATKLCLLMTYEVFLQGDVIFKAGEKAKKIYFLYSGSVVIYSQKGKEIMHYYEGQQFGSATFADDNIHPASIAALESSECYVLRYNSFMQVVGNNTEYIDLVRNAANKKVKHILMIHSED